MKVIQTRKHEALYVFRRAALLALLLLLLGGYNFTPAQAVREGEQLFSLPNTETVHSETIALTPFHLYRVSLSRVEDTLLFTPARFTPLRGWKAEHFRILEPGKADESFGSWIECRGNRGTVVLFGFAPAEEPLPAFTVEHFSDEWDITSKNWALAFREELTPDTVIETAEGRYYICSCRYDAPGGNRGQTEITRSDIPTA